MRRSKATLGLLADCLDGHLKEVQGREVPVEALELDQDLLTKNHTKYMQDAQQSVARFSREFVHARKRAAGLQPEPAPKRQKHPHTASADARPLFPARAEEIAQLPAAGSFGAMVERHRQWVVRAVCVLC